MKGTTIGGVEAASLTKRFGTPLYVYEATVVRARCRDLKRAFPKFAVHYAIKANANPALLKIIKREGLGAEAVSVGELRIAAHAGFAKQNISFTGPSLTESELEFVASHAGRVHIDSLTQLSVWGRKKLGDTVSLRLNLGIGAGHHAHVRTGGDGSKFGIVPGDIPAALEIAKTYGVSITGLQQHIGSHVPDGSDYVEGARVLLEYARRFPDITHLDFGGGIGVPYAPNEKRVNLQKLGRDVRAHIAAYERETGRKHTCALEPGRYVVAEAGHLLATVTDIKKTAAHTFVGINSGFNHLVRPAMYGSYHAVRNLSRPKGKRAPITIVGNVCESGDVFAWDRESVVPEVGDVLSIETVGAYGMSMASTYNLQALPREILVDNSRAREVSFDRAPFLTRL